MKTFDTHGLFKAFPEFFMLDYVNQKVIEV